MLPHTALFRSPPADPAVFTLDAPLTLEPDVDALLAADRKRWVGFPPDMDMADMGMADMAETDPAAGPAEEPADPSPPRMAVSGIPPVAARATLDRKSTRLNSSN